MLFDVVLTPAEIDHLPEQDLASTVCIVFDVLRATSSMVTGLAHGVEEIRPVCTIEEALALRGEWPGAVLGGERFGDRIEGFDLGNSPQEYCREGLRRVVTTTTNGTVALRACEGAREVWTGALLNMAALEERLRQTAPERITLVCAGTFRELALEDALAAGMLVSAFPEAQLTDAARLARAIYLEHRDHIPAALRLAKNGQALLAHGRGGDVEWCARVSRFPVVGLMREGVVRKG
ncbi:MAG: 2-phosphosulfolactate phosphatase [Chthoniobacteraceae bacterium]|nr:2-phosphosulfolactate phosphatase [Chthoniobacteraceae bacterium]